MGKTLILIDGHALAFRQYYALERTQMRTNSGTPTWAVYGFFKSVFDLLKNQKLKADAIAVAFDVSHVTFRTEKFAEYKSNRSAMPDDMQAQMSLIYKGLKAFNIPVYTKEGFEADDVIGTISKRACELGHKVLILTGDQDAFQLVDKEGCVKVIIPVKGELIEYDWNKIYEKLGVYPNQVIDYKGLRGDKSDCIPGIRGIGEVSAQKLLARFGSLEGIYENCENIQEKSLKEKIITGRDSALLSQELATIIRDLDIDFNFENTQVELPNVDEVTKFLKKLQFHTFLRNLDDILKTFNKNPILPEESDNSEHTEPETDNSEPLDTGLATSSSQLGLFSANIPENKKVYSEIDFSSKIITDSQDLNELVEKLNKSSLFTFKIYADFLNAVNSSIIGIGLAYNKDLSADKRIEDANKGAVTETFYIPIFNTCFENKLKAEDVISCLKPLFENEQVKKITYDSKNQYNILKNAGIEVKGVIFDIMLASYVKDTNRKHELDVQSLEYLNHAIMPVCSSDKRNKPKFQDADSENLTRFVSDELFSINELTKFWIKNLDEKELNLVYDIELPLSFVLADMEYTGVSIDENYLSELTHDMNERLESISYNIFEIAGTKFNINSPRQVSDILFEKLGLKARKKRGKTAYSTSASVLEELAEEYEIARLILDYRKYAKLKSTYTDALPELVDSKDGRIHTTYNQTVTTTGRLSSSNPNLQNIPARTDYGNKIRNAFVPEDRENCLILSADYSQIELRLLAHISGDNNLCEAFKKGVDIHTLTASKIFEVPVEEVTKEMRYKAKAVNFGIIYGQSKYGLAKAFGIGFSEAEEFINKYFATYPMIKVYMEATIKQVESIGYVETLFGRKRDLSVQLSSSNVMIREFAKRAAINQPIQGTAADLMKMAMIEFAKQLKENNLKSKMIMQVHDEIVVEMYKNEEEAVKRLVVQSMELGQPFKVPLVVDVNIGETWKE